MRLNLTATVVAVGLCLLLAGVVQAASTQVPSTGVSLWRGTSKLSDSNNRVVDPSTGTLTGLTAENCEGIRDRIIQRDAVTRTTGTATYRCQIDLKAVVTFRANPTCPLLPPPDARTIDCPAGFTGAYTQSRSYTAAPYPACSTAGEWIPAEPPSGVCVPVPSEQWTFCSNEYQNCSFSGTRRVRFGLDTRWVERDLTASGGGVACRIATFSSDPAVGATKRCELRAQVAATGTASLSWTPPTQNTDGTSLTNLAGYRISYGASAAELVQTIQIENTAVTTHTIEALAPGAYYFAVRAYTSSGTESVNSNVVSKVVQ